MTTDLLLLGGGVAAGLFGSLLGLGGGILIVPLLTLGLLGFSLPIHQAVGVSLVSVIVTSGASGGVYLRRGVANLRLGMLLELFTASGALVGGLIAFLVPDRLLAALFAGLLVYTGLTMLRGGRVEYTAGAAGAEDADEDAAAAPTGLGDTPPDRSVEASRGLPRGTRLLDEISEPGYSVRNLPGGIVAASLAGVVSALLGIGGGIVKVPVMHVVMGVPLRVSAATSNVMIGITAASSAIIYLLRGGIDPYVAGPTALGVFAGASVGSRLVERVDVRILRLLFVAVLAYTAAQMAGRALGL
ncbi:MAG TPA: sulfite exporter TauE/SafE family protein [Candidatus Limnocylindrales bacterium]|nr:sulfite exporter TauE/SafE family protein [Candidatus Limnocylindrales bacterium]